MAWTQVTNLKGDAGAPGQPGDDGRTVEIEATATHLRWRYAAVVDGPAASAWTDLVPLSELKGADGTSVEIQGTVADSAALTGIVAPQPGHGYITEDNGHLWIYDGSGWIDAGEIRGPAGPAGQDGQDGAAGDEGPAGPRGSQWYSGAGTPGSIAGSAPGDFYLDTTSGDVWALS